LRRNVGDGAANHAPSSPGSPERPVSSINPVPRRFTVLGVRPYWVKRLAIVMAFWPPTGISTASNGAEVFSGLLSYFANALTSVLRLRLLGLNVDVAAVCRPLRAAWFVNAFVTARP